MKIKRNLGIIIQARMGSTRLPGKVLLPISGEPLILNIIHRLKKDFDFQIIVATTNNSKDDKLAEFLFQQKILVFRGTENHVTKRYIGAAKYFGITDVVRVCADNPFIDARFLNQLIIEWEKDNISDYLSYEFADRPVILSHFGIFAEIVKLSALEKVISLFPTNNFYAEHVTNGIYLNPGIFKVRLLNINKFLTPFEGIRLTIDTLDDFNRIKKLKRKFEDANFEEIANYLLSQPKILQEMKKEIQLNIK